MGLSLLRLVKSATRSAVWPSVCGALAGTLAAKEVARPQVSSRLPKTVVVGMLPAAPCGGEALGAGRRCVPKSCLCRPASLELVGAFQLV